MDVRILDEKETVIVLDTNIFLDTVRVRLHTANLYIKLIEKIQDRLWIPYQVKRELEDNLVSTLEKNKNRYQIIKNQMKNDLKNFKNKIMEKKLTELNKNYFMAIESLKEEISHKIEEIDGIIDNYDGDGEYCKLAGEVEDSKERLNKIIDTLKNENRIGIRPNSHEIGEICIEGEERYEKKIPPGFEDSCKDSEKNRSTESINGEKKFGDLFIWKEILKLPKNDINIKNIIFVTNDNKVDWFIHGKPHPSLLEEFQRNCPKQKIYIINGAEFYKILSKHFSVFEVNTYLQLYTENDIKYHFEINQKVQKYLEVYLNEKLGRTLPFIDLLLINKDIIREKQEYESGLLKIYYEMKIDIISQYNGVSKPLVLKPKLETSLDSFMVYFTREVHYDEINGLISSDIFKDWNIIPQ